MAARNTEQAPEVTDADQAPDVEGYTKLKSPAGAVTSVPDSIKDALVEGGYKPVRK